MEPGIAPIAAAAAWPWDKMLKCPVCLSAKGEPCKALNGKMIGNRPDGVAVDLPRAHHARKWSKRVA